MTRVRAFALLLALVPLAGCDGKSDKGVTVTGRVTLDGQPLPAGQVVLEIPGNREQRVGGIAADGKFEVREVPPGKVRVAVRTSMFQGQQSAEQRFAARAGGKADRPTFVPVPTKYENPGTSRLEFDVVAGQPLTIELKK
jgi:hypothetical protein